MLLEQEDMEMRTYDFSPYYRSSVGFDRMLDLLGAGAQSKPETKVEESYPPYDIERTGEDSYRITIALAGYSRNEISIMAEPNALLVEGERAQDDSPRNFMHRGISQRPFRRQFDLADFVKVNRACYENGLLQIDLEREIPEAMKPRRIEISASAAAPRRERVREHRAERKQVEDAA